MPNIPKTTPARVASIVFLLALMGAVWLLLEHPWGPKATGGSPSVLRTGFGAAEDSSPPDASGLAFSAPETSERVAVPGMAFGRLIPPESRPLDGEVRFSTRNAELTWSEVRTEVVRANSWKLGELEAETLVRLHAISLDGRPAWPVDSVARLPEDLILRVPVRFQAPEVLCVHDAETWEALPSVSLLECSSLEACRERTAARPHPAQPDAELKPAVRSAPLDLHGLKQPATLWIAAEGHAWEEVHLMHREARPWCVGLRRAGALEVAVAGHLPDVPGSRRTLRLHSVEGQAAARPDYELRVPPDEGLYRYSNIAQGTYRIVEVVSAGIEECAVVGERVQIGPDHVASVRLPPAAVWSEDACALVLGLISADDRGVLEAVKSVVLTPRRVQCSHPAQPIKKLSLGADLRLGGSTSLEWDPVPLLPGTYRVDLKPIGYSFSVEVPPAPSYVLERHLRGAVEVTVDVVDSEHGRPVPYGWLAATSVPASERSGIFGAPLSMARRTGTSAVVSLMPGWVRFSVGFENGATQHFVREVEAAQAIQLRLEQVSILRVRSVSLGRPRLLREADWTALRFLDVAGQPVRVGTMRLGASPFPGWASEIEYLLPVRGELDLELAGRRARVQIGGDSGATSTVEFDLSQDPEAPRR